MIATVFVFWATFSTFSFLIPFLSTHRLPLFFLSSSSSSSSSYYYYNPNSKKKVLEAVWNGKIKQNNHFQIWPKWLLSQVKMRPILLVNDSLKRILLENTFGLMREWGKKKTNICEIHFAKWWPLYVLNVLRGQRNVSWFRWLLFSWHQVTCFASRRRRLSEKWYMKKELLLYQIEKWDSSKQTFVKGGWKQTI